LKTFGGLQRPSKIFADVRRDSKEFGVVCEYPFTILYLHFLLSYKPIEVI
jgi:hypothetical protein